MMTEQPPPQKKIKKNQLVSQSILAPVVLHAYVQLILSACLVVSVYGFIINWKLSVLLNCYIITIIFVNGCLYPAVSLNAG